MTAPLLIDNGTILTGGEKTAVLPGHSVLIEDGRIARIAPARALASFRGRRLDASGQVVLPGLINAHTHWYSAFARGMTKTRPATDFGEVLRHLWWRLDSALTTEDCHVSALLGLIDSIRHGTTTVIDHHASPNAVEGSLDALARAVRATGMRACLCYEVSDRGGAGIARAGLAENAAFLRRCQRAPDPHLAGLFGLHASFTLSDRTLDAAVGLARDLGAGFHLHVAEAPSDQTIARRRHRRSVVARLAHAGILGERTLAAHCIHVGRREMDLLAETGTAAIHNPQSNLNNAVGIADVVALAARGVRVGLGTDAMTANLLEELRVALWAQHLRAGNPSVGFAEVVRALTVNNARIASQIFGRPLGRLAEGAAADVVIADYDPPTPLTRGNWAGHLVFGLSQAAIDTTIVDGRVLMRHRQLTLDLDEARLHARARRLATRLWQRL
ncbi:MAG: putative aminohydrolase SsnA [Verrucomicrobia bacterium]|nr:putative aminohydrolase SsnA [Verrucomicrobiota bacterium]